MPQSNQLVSSTKGLWSLGETGMGAHAPHRSCMISFGSAPVIPSLSMKSDLFPNLPQIVSTIDDDCYSRSCQISDFPSETIIKTYLSVSFSPQCDVTPLHGCNDYYIHGKPRVIMVPDLFSLEIYLGKTLKTESLWCHPWQKVDIITIHGFQCWRMIYL